MFPLVIQISHVLILQEQLNYELANELAIQRRRLFDCWGSGRRE